MDRPSFWFDMGRHRYVSSIEEEGTTRIPDVLHRVLRLPCKGSGLHANSVSIPPSSKLSHAKPHLEWAHCWRQHKAGSYYHATASGFDNIPAEYPASDSLRLRTAV